ncbi:hypothetical protein ABIE18_002089 [Arthrobacter sp. 2762]
MEVITKAGIRLEVFKVNSPVQIVVAGPEALKERIVFWSFHGSKLIEPSIELVFTLGAKPTLGELTLSTSSWAFADDLAASGIREALTATKGPCVFSAELMPVSFVQRNGFRAGQLASYHRLVLATEQGPVNLSVRNVTI